MRIKSSVIKATGELYPELQVAYDHLNERLFAAMLPPCLITLNRSKRTLGYFSPGRFVRHDGQLTHEIALNPAYFAARTLKDTLSTIAHEQVHLWQDAFGQPSRRGYHNKEWSTMAEAIGLMPSDTGAPGGAKIGEHMDHYIIPGAMFDRAADELLGHAFRLSWLDRYPEAVPLGADFSTAYTFTPATSVETDPGKGEGEGGEGAASAIAVEGASVSSPRLPDGFSLGGAELEIVWPSDRRPKATKIKYRCPGCGNQVWGKGGMDLQCNPCDQMLREMG